MKTFLSLVIVSLAIIGILDAGYITYDKVWGITPRCGFGFECGRVLNSQWASVGPIPLSAIGLVYYLTILSLAAANFLEFPLIKVVITHLSQIFNWPWSGQIFRKIGNLSALRVMTYLTSLGLAFSIYLIGIMAFVIQSWCLYCLIS